MHTLQCTRVILAAFAVLILNVFLILSGCSKSGSDGALGPAGMTGPSGVEIYSIVANPSAIRPGASTALSVSAGDGVNSALTYSWQADAGTLNSNSTSSVIWTAPATVGSYMVSVEVANAAGLKSRGYASILVSVSPTGPIITSVNPAEARAGDQIRITGAGFGSTQGSSSVSIGSAPTSTIISWSDTVILATIPTSATTGSVIVTEAGVNSSPGYIAVLWSKSNIENVAVSTATNGQETPQLVSDGSGGAIITWTDARSGNWDIYAQRVNSIGVAQWTADGVVISAASGSQLNPKLVSDGSGGAIIAWEDQRNGNIDIYAQRVSSSGMVQWTADGVAVSVAAGNQQSFQLISDNSGGAIITWNDSRSGSNDIYVQRLNGAGLVQWTTNGVAICAAANEQQLPQLLSDGSGGAIITWQDFRSGVGDIYAQRVNSSGLAQWAVNGVAIAKLNDEHWNPKIISDGSGGAIITWQDSRSLITFWDIYAQRVNGDGVVQWTVNGVIIAASASTQQNPQIISDGSGGAIITWEDNRSSDWNIYAQRVNGTGTTQWTVNGVSLSSVDGTQSNARIVSDDSGGAIITWQDARSGTNDIFAQRVNSTGAVQWTVDGVAISAAASNQLYPQLVSDGSGGAIITWQDYRNATTDIYAQGISASGRQ